MKSTDLVLKRYNIGKITVTMYHAAADGLNKRGHRPIPDALSKVTDRSNERKEMLIEHQPAVLWADKITVRRTTRDSPF